MPKSTWEWKRTENETQNVFLKFQKIGSPLECGLPRLSGPLRRTLEACKSTGYVKFTLDRELWRSSGRPHYMAPRSSVNFPVRADTMSTENTGNTNFTLERRFPRSSRNQNSGKSRTCSWASIRHSKVPNAWFWLKLHIYIFSHGISSNFNTMTLNFTNQTHACPKLTQTHHQHTKFKHARLKLPWFALACEIYTMSST